MVACNILEKLDEMYTVLHVGGNLGNQGIQTDVQEGRDLLSHTTIARYDRSAWGVQGLCSFGF